jgi:hypothetical protein
MRIKELARGYGFRGPARHRGLPVGPKASAPISVFKEAVEKETGILTESTHTIGSSSCRSPIVWVPITAILGGLTLAR